MCRLKTTQMLGQCQLAFSRQHDLSLENLKGLTLSLVAFGRFLNNVTCATKSSLSSSQFLYCFKIYFLKKLRNFRISQPNCLKSSPLSYSSCYSIISNFLLKLQIYHGNKTQEKKMCIDEEKRLCLCHELAYLSTEDPRLTLVDQLDQGPNQWKHEQTVQTETGQGL